MGMAKKEGLNMKVDTLVKNEAGVKFYEKLGFKRFNIDFVMDNSKKLKL